MVKTKKGPIFVATVLMLLAFSAAAFANKSAVTIQAPPTAQNGSDILIKVRVSHEGNNFIHYTEWVSVKVNGAEVARWEFSAFNRPASENFTREMTVTVNGPTEIVAEASCNIHGSSGPAKVVVEVK
jgi:desulfoferrodoxin (superoxide reductase-like protein)